MEAAVSGAFFIYWRWIMKLNLKNIRLIKIFVVIFIMLLTFAAGCGNSWHEYSNANFKMKAQFPVKPSESSKMTNKMPFGNIDTYIIVTEKDGIKYEISYTEFPANFKGFVPFSKPEKILSDLTNMIIKVSLKANLIEKKDVTVDGVNGNEIKMELNDGKYGAGRIFFNDNRAYVVVVKTTKELIDSENVKKFVNSFGFIK